MSATNVFARGWWQVAGATLFLFLTAGCFEKVNDELVLPTTDERIGQALVDKTVGSPGGKSAISKMVPDGGTGFYYTGWFNGREVVGRLSRDGEQQWYVKIVDVRDFPCATDVRAGFRRASRVERIVARPLV